MEIFSVYPIMVNMCLWFFLFFFSWQSLHHEMSLYIQQLTIDIEKEKLSDNIAKLEKQINKEKKLIRRGRTKGLIKQHEVKTCFHSHFVIIVGFILNGLICPWLGLNLL